MTDTEKILEEIISELFEYGKRYGEDLGHVKDDVLYELRTDACDDAIREIDKTLSTPINQAIAEEREKLRVILEQRLLIKCECENGDCANCDRLTLVIDNLSDFSSLDKPLTALEDLLKCEPLMSKEEMERTIRNINNKEDI